MAIQVSGTTVISNTRGLNNIASLDATTIATINENISAALPPPTAGTAHLIMRLQEAAVSTTVAYYEGVGYQNRHSSLYHLGVTCLVSGTITAYFEHRRNTALSYVRILKNGSQVAEWSNSSTSFVARSLDVSVSVGDVIIFQHRSGRSGDSAIWRYLRIYSNNPNFAVA